jgi:hypothetical protein
MCIGSCHPWSALLCHPGAHRYDSLTDLHTCRETAQGRQTDSNKLVMQMLMVNLVAPAPARAESIRQPLASYNDCGIDHTHMTNPAGLFSTPRCPTHHSRALLVCQQHAPVGPPTARLPHVFKGVCCLRRSRLNKTSLGFSNIFF